MITNFTVKSAKREVRGLGLSLGLGLRSIRGVA